MAADPVSSGTKPLTVGQAVRFVRERLHPQRHRVRITQEQLYWLCHDIEAQTAPAARLPGRRAPAAKFKAVNDYKYAERKIRGIENNEARQDRLTRNEIEILGRAFGLGPGFFLRTFRDNHELERAYLDEMRSTDGELPPSRVERAPGAGVGFRRLGDNERLPPQRDELVERLGEIASAQDRARHALVLLEGRSGVGKTFLISRWFQDHGGRLFPGGGLCVDCTSKSTDQILPAIEGQFPFALSGDDGLARLIALDGVSLTAFREGPRPARSVDSRPALSELVRCVAPLLDADAPPTMILVALENNATGVEEAALLRELPTTTRFARFRVPPLEQAEGSAFLRSLGVTQFDGHDLEQISAAVMGMPSALTVAAFEISRLSEQEREHYVDRLRSGHARGAAGVSSEFEDFFRGLLMRLNDDVSRAGDEGRHPHALMRLLALMPGPIPLQHLESLLESRSINRLQKLRGDEIPQLELPLISIVDDWIDVHAMVRLILRAELEAFVSDDAFDAYTSRDELEWIHWRMATLLWSVIEHLASGKGDPELDGGSLAAVEAFIYHVTAQIRLLPREGPQATARRRKRQPAGVSPTLVEAFLERWGRLPDVTLWQLAYHKVAKPVLLDQRYRMTRVHGQYEAKARILGYLVSTAEEGSVPVPGPMLAELSKEIAVCHMHAGRLILASHAIEEAERRLLVAYPDLADPAPGSKALHHWPLYCEIMSAASTIKTRSGRIAPEVAKSMEDLVRTAEYLIAHETQRASGEFAPPTGRGALRLFTRNAELTLLKDGDVESALQRFEAANRLQQVIRNRDLDGEAARRYVMALVRGRHEDPSRLQRAVALVDANLARYRELAAGGGALSADILPFEILSAALARIEGRSEEARDRLQAVEQHEYFLRRECTFVTLVELELEKLRQGIARSETVAPEVHDMALELMSKLRGAHHLLLSLDAAVLAAEAASGATKVALIREVRRQIQPTGWRLRLADVAELERGGSAVRRFGL